MSGQRQRGFTLIEIMAVIFVIGLALSMASLVINRDGPRDDIWNAIDRFLGYAHFAGERAIISGETMGLMLEPPPWQVERGQRLDDVGWRYRWVTNSSEGWQELPNVTPVSLSPTIKLMVYVDDTLWDWEAQIDRQTPVAALYNSGDITPIRIEFTDSREPGFMQTVEVNENGELVWVEAPEVPDDGKGF